MLGMREPKAHQAKTPKKLTWQTPDTRASTKSLSVFPQHPPEPIIQQRRSPLALPPMIRRSLLKTLAEAGTHPLNNAIKKSAELGLSRPNLRQGHFKGILPKALMTGADNFLYEQVGIQLDKLLTVLFENTTAEIDPLKHAGIQVAKEALTCMIVISIMNAIENTHHRSPFHEGVMKELGVTLSHLLLTNHIKQLTEHNLVALMAKMAIPVFISTQDGLSLAKGVQTEFQIPASKATYIFDSALVKTCQILFFELLTRLVPATTASEQQAQ
jgi:hypothetical protein